MAKRTSSPVTTPKPAKSSREAAAWSFTGAFTLIGLGVGFLINQIPASLFIGIGVGLLISMILRYRDTH